MYVLFVYSSTYMYRKKILTFGRPRDPDRVQASVIVIHVCRLTLPPLSSQKWLKWSPWCDWASGKILEVSAHGRGRCQRSRYAQGSCLLSASVQKLCAARHCFVGVFGFRRIEEGLSPAQSSSATSEEKVKDVLSLMILRASDFFLRCRYLSSFKGSTFHYVPGT